MTRSHRYSAAVMGVLLAVSSSSCTHNPITGDLIADTFEGCMGVNTGLALGLGVLVGKLTESKEAGAAAGLGTLLVAWHKCAQAHQKVVNTEEKSREEIQTGGTAGSALRIDQLALTVGPPGEDINSVVRYTVLASDPAKKDIPVRETRTILVPRFVQDAQGRLYYADAQDKPLPDAAGRPIPVGGKTPPDPDALVYRDYAFPVDNVVKQGMRKADGLLPTDKGLPGNLPYRFRFVVEAEGLRMDKEVDFHFSKPGQTARTFSTQDSRSAASYAPAPVTAQKPAASATTETVSQTADGWPGAATRPAYLREKPGGKTLPRVPAGPLLVVVEDTAGGAKDDKETKWVRVRTESGAAGWMRRSEIRGLK